MNERSDGQDLGFRRFFGDLNVQFINLIIEPGKWTDDFENVILNSAFPASFFLSFSILVIKISQICSILMKFTKSIVELIQLSSVDFSNNQRNKLKDILP